MGWLQVCRAGKWRGEIGSSYQKKRLMRPGEGYMPSGGAPLPSPMQRVQSAQLLAEFEWGGARCIAGSGLVGCVGRTSGVAIGLHHADASRCKCVSRLFAQQANHRSPLPIARRQWGNGKARRVPLRTTVRLHEHASSATPSSRDACVHAAARLPERKAAVELLHASRSVL